MTSGSQAQQTWRTAKSEAGKLDDLPGWEQATLTELAAKRFDGAWIRIHDSGDFFRDDYLLAWLRICRARPDLHFYGYTKEVERFRRLVEPAAQLPLGLLLRSSRQLRLLLAVESEHTSLLLIMLSEGPDEGNRPKPWCRRLCALSA